MESKKTYPDRELGAEEYTARLTLKSHPGKGVVQRMRSDENEKFDEKEIARHNH